MASKLRSDAEVQIRSPGRRGRPSAARVAAIEGEILDAAHSLFLQLGYEAASMEGVAERAGVSKGTLYVRYAAKELLFRAVIRNRLDKWSAMAGAQDHLLPCDLDARLLHHARTLARIFTWPEYRQTSQLVQTAAISLPDVAFYWQEQGTRKFIEFLAADMASAAEGKLELAEDCGAGREAAGHPDWYFLAGLFLHSFSGWFALEVLAGEVSDDLVNSFARKLVDTILAVVATHDEWQRKR